MTRDVWNMTRAVWNMTRDVWDMTRDLGNMAGVLCKAKCNQHESKLGAEAVINGSFYTDPPAQPPLTTGADLIN
jgi:hypothetical protein